MPFLARTHRHYPQALFRPVVMMNLYYALVAEVLLFRKL